MAMSISEIFVKKGDKINNLKSPLSNIIVLSFSVIMYYVSFYSISLSFYHAILKVFSNFTMSSYTEQWICLKTIFNAFQHHWKEEGACSHSKAIVKWLIIYFILVAQRSFLVTKSWWGKRNNYYHHQPCKNWRNIPVLHGGPSIQCP